MALRSVQLVKGYIMFLFAAQVVAEAILNAVKFASGLGGVPAISELLEE